MKTDLTAYTLHDALPTFLDANGHPVIGRLIFFEANGTTYKPVYGDQDYQTRISNPLLTDLAGRPSVQPFLKNGIYRVVVQKFIGTNYADMAQYQFEDYNPLTPGTVSHWEFVKEFVIDSGTMDEGEVTDTEIFTVQYISDLRAVNFEDHPIVTVIDYDENIKHIAPRTYVWEASSSRPEDYGATIISSRSNSGRWELLESSTIESTTFGISPYVEQGVLASRLNGLSVYSQAGYAKASVIYFQSGTYRLNNGAFLKFGKKVVCSSSLNFLCESGTAKVAFLNGLEYTGSTPINSANVALIIKESVVHSKWYFDLGVPMVFNGSYHYWDTLVLDNPTMHTVSVNDSVVEVADASMVLTATDCTVKFVKNVTSNGSVFTNCTFLEGTGNFNGRATFTGDSYIYGWMFSENIDISNLTIGPNVRFDVYSFGAQKYAELKIKQGNHDIGNLNGGAIDITLMEASATDADIYTIENGSGSIDCHSNKVNLLLRNFNGSVTNLNSQSKLSVNDCFIETSLIDGEELAALDSSVVLGSLNPECSLKATDSLIIGANNVKYMFSSVESYSSELDLDICARESDIKDSIVGRSYTMIAKAGEPRDVTFQNNTVSVEHFISGRFDNNLFKGCFKIDGESAQTLGGSHVLVDSLTFRNNESTLESSDAWEITRLGCMASDALNTYTFTNNTGGFECSKVLRHIPVIDGAGIITAPETLGIPISADFDHDIGVWHVGKNISTDPNNPSYADTMENYFTKMRMFVIGLYDAEIDLEITLLNEPKPAGNLYTVQPNLANTFTSHRLFPMTSPSKVEAHLSSYSKYVDLDNSTNFTVPDIAKDPGTEDEEWQIRNFNLGHTRFVLNSSETIEASIRLRQMDKRF